jgi:hypothetical protein
MRSFTRIVAAIAALLAGASTAQSTVLTSNDLLLVTFTTSPGATPVPDTLTLNLGQVQVMAAHTARTGALFDGATLLGTGSTTSFGNHVGALSLSPARSWRSPTSVWNFDNPAVADFTTVANGTINGRIEFAIATGAMDINLNNVSLGMGRAFQANAFTNSNPQPVVTSVQIIPEPAALSATLPAAGGLLLSRRRRVRHRDAAAPRGLSLSMNRHPAHRSFNL